MKNRTLAFFVLLVVTTITALAQQTVPSGTVLPPSCTAPALFILKTGAVGKLYECRSGVFQPVTPVLGTAALLNVAASGDATSGEVVKGNDTRLTDARTPAAHNQAWSTITATPTTLAGYGITDAISGTLPGSNKQFLFNNSGVLGAAAGVEYNATTGVAFVVTQQSNTQYALQVVQNVASNDGGGAVKIGIPGKINLYIDAAQYTAPDYSLMQLISEDAAYQAQFSLYDPFPAHASNFFITGDAGSMNFAHNNSGLAGTQAYNIPNSGYIYDNGAGGIGINASHASGVVAVFAGGSALTDEKLRITPSSGIQLSAPVIAKTNSATALTVKPASDSYTAFPFKLDPPSGGGASVTFDPTYNAGGSFHFQVNGSAFDNFPTVGVKGVDNNDGAGGSSFGMESGASGVGFSFNVNGGGYSGSNLLSISKSAILRTLSNSDGGLIFTAQHVTAPIIFGAGGFALTDEKLRITPSTGVQFSAAPVSKTAAGVSVGSATLPFKYGFFAGDSLTPASNNFKLTGTATGLRTVTLPDVSGTVGIVAGSNKQLQFNNAGVLGGTTGIEYQSGASPNLTITAQSATHRAFLFKGATASQTTAIGQIESSDGNQFIRFDPALWEGDALRIQNLDSTYDYSQGLSIINAGTTSGAYITVGADDATKFFAAVYTPVSAANANLITAPNAGSFRSGGGATGGMAFIAQAASAPIIFAAGGFAFTDEKVRITPSSGIQFSAAPVSKTAAGVDVGSAILPFKYLYLAGDSGTPGTNNYKFKGTATAPRDVTFPDASITVARIDAAQTFTGTQTFGALVATTINGNTFTTGTGTLTIAAGKTVTISNTLAFTGTDSSSVAFGAGGTVLYSGGALGTPSSITLTNGTAYPYSSLIGSVTNASIANTTFNTAYTYTTGVESRIWSGNTSTSSLFLIQDNNTSGSGYIADFQATSSSSNLKPFRLIAKNSTLVDTTATGLITVTPAATSGIGTGDGFTITTAVNSLTSGNLLKIFSNVTTGLTGLSGLEIAISGANASSGQTIEGATISVTNTNGTSGTNNALTLAASGANTANNALNVTTGRALLGGGVAIGSGGGVITKSLIGSATLDFANLAAVGCEDLTITVTGAVTGDSVILGVPNGSIVANGNFTAWVSAADTVSVRFCTVVSGDPASGTFKVTVLQQ